MSQGPLDYGRPTGSPGAGKNQWWKVCLRILAGIAAGVGSCVAGWFLAAATGLPALFLIPPLTVLGVAIFVAVKFRRFGYVTGIVLAPFLITVAGVVLLFMVCSGTIK